MGKEANWERFEPRDAAAWRAWLAEHHTRTDGVWLVMGKKGSGCENLTWDEAVEESICFGWIDSLPRKLDDQRSMLLVTPRKPKSVWSALNKRRVEKLQAEGRLMPPGITKIEAAKADGSWSSLDAIEAMVMPPDFAAALEACPAARTNYEAFPRGARKNILTWIGTARTTETRSKRIDETVRLAAENRRANQYERKKS